MRRGLSLMEVVLALAILGISLAMIGELVRLGTRAGEAARDDMESQLICESLINEIAAGTQLPEMVIDQPVDEFGEWLYSVETQPVDAASLIAIRVSVRRADAILPTNRVVIPYSLTRWVMDPEVEMAAREAEALMEEQLALRAAAQASGTQTDSGAAATDPGAAGGAPPPGGDQPQASPPPGAPPGFDASQLPQGFDRGRLPPGFDPSTLPPGFDPSSIDPSRLPPGLIPGQGGRGGRGGGAGGRGGGGAGGGGFGGGAGGGGAFGGGGAGGGRGGRGGGGGGGGAPGGGGPRGGRGSGS